MCAIAATGKRRTASAHHIRHEFHAVVLHKLRRQPPPHRLCKEPVVAIGSIDKVLRGGKAIAAEGDLVVFTGHCTLCGVLRLLRALLATRAETTEPAERTRNGSYPQLMRHSGS